MATKEELVRTLSVVKWMGNKICKYRVTEYVVKYILLHKQTAASFYIQHYFALHHWKTELHQNLRIFICLHNETWYSVQFDQTHCTWSQFLMKIIHLFLKFLFRNMDIHYLCIVNTHINMDIHYLFNVNTYIKSIYIYCKQHFRSCRTALTSEDLKDHIT
jgi:hypothetical protein